METTATPCEKKPATFTVRQLSPALGAEILGVDLRDPIDDALKQKFFDAWHQHLVILLRNQTLDEDAQVRFAETFGPPAKNTSGRTFGVKHPSVMLVSNIREDGKPIGALPDGEMHFHTDQCHQATPAKATMLYAIEIPSKGGNTLFSNAYAAYETLPDDIKQRIAGRRALNAYTTDTTLRSAQLRRRQVVILASGGAYASGDGTQGALRQSSDDARDRRAAAGGERGDPAKAVRSSGSSRSSSTGMSGVRATS